eukprot:198556-Amphidinium_carterae.1
MEQREPTTQRVHQDVPDVERRDLQLRTVSYRVTTRDEDDASDTEHRRRHQITHADELQAIYSRL